MEEIKIRKTRNFQFLLFFNFNNFLDILVSIEIISNYYSPCSHFVKYFNEKASSLLYGFLAL